MPVPEHSKFKQLINRLIEIHNRFLTQAYSQSSLSCLSPKEIQIMEIIATEKSMTMGALALRSSLAMSTLSGIVSRLETLNMIERRHSDNDRRIIEVHLKENGLNACAQRDEIRDELCHHILSPLSENEQNELIRLLDILVSNAAGKDYS